jgi:D-serine dehydratase
MLKDYPLINTLKERKEVLWVNPNLNNNISSEITVSDISDASDRLRRFAPYLAGFPDTSGGIIESELKEISNMKAFVAGKHGISPKGRFLLKCDNALPISGSIKARGGVYEVLRYAENIAVKTGLVTVNDDYSVFASDTAKRIFANYSISVGSTGNLGLSIGIMGRNLGFNVTVHMSADAKQWKKDLLREKGAKVVEHKGDYEKAVAAGRNEAEAQPNCHFVDDENSRDLFLGYCVAGERIAAQLKEMNITVDDEHPLFVYLPCGVGGGPGGVAFGIKQIYGKNSHIFFAEPVEAPCMLLSVMTGLGEKISALDIGLSGVTIADGLAVTRASALVSRVAGNLLDGLSTVSDESIKELVSELFKKEGVFVEPSAAAGFLPYAMLHKNIELIKRYGDKLENSVHIIWATGGNMVPEAERQRYLV